MDYFLFDGGTYKRGVDDGRYRIPLNLEEIHEVFRDPEVPGTTDNAITGRIHLSGFDEFAQAGVGDHFYLQILPDVTGYRGITCLVQDAYPGYNFTLDLVRAADVYNSIQANQPTDNLAIIGDPLSVAMADGVGNSPRDATYLAKLHGDTFQDHRNSNGFFGGYFQSPVIMGIGSALYIRMTITAVPSVAVPTTCGSCSEPYGLGEIQYSVLIDDLGIDKTRIKNYCTCNARICHPGH